MQLQWPTWLEIDKEIESDELNSNTKYQRKPGNGKVYSFL